VSASCQGYPQVPVFRILGRETGERTDSNSGSARLSGRKVDPPWLGADAGAESLGPSTEEADSSGGPRGPEDLPFSALQWTSEQVGWWAEHAVHASAGTASVLCEQRIQGRALLLLSVESLRGAGVFLGDTLLLLEAVRGLVSDGRLPGASPALVLSTGAPLAANTSSSGSAGSDSALSAGPDDSRDGGGTGTSDSGPHVTSTTSSTLHGGLPVWGLERDRGRGLRSISHTELGTDSRPLGAGSFGAVVGTQWRKNTSVAVKQNGIEASNEVAIQNEVALHDLLLLEPHPNIVTVFGLCVDHPDKRVRLVMQVCEKGSLDNLLKCAQPEVCTCLVA
jgi:hypothetical protein